ncbi:TdeIII family type II restriction endonuclease [uncultured Draconibacterium sp.]|uniref:TdeIII family type II restriction endonuclease n=1 Tax=uncultured Draconibacterium sp. TaxID=1573823 RepID=UPI002AA95E4F|nr:TdeIII family type II restriction endonuclease [uncultured Draconibacterium sp.]
MKKETEDKIRKILTDCVDGALKRTQKNRTHRPFHEYLLTKELVNASAFERSFSTSFGQGPIEEISRLVALDSGYEVVRQKDIHVNVYKGAIDEVERICSSLRDGEKSPNWEKEEARVLAYGKGDTEVRRVISDLWIKKNNIETFISIKTVKPNLDQTEKAKRDMLLLKAHNPNFKTYFGLFYNPGGENREDYNWTIPFKIFNMHTDDVVLIGKDYWNKLGDENTYSDLLQIFDKVGEDTRSKIINLK